MGDAEDEKTVDDGKPLPLLPEDHDYISQKGLTYTLHAPEGKRQALVIPGVHFDTSRYVPDLPESDPRARDVVDVLIWIPKGYPQAKLDMFWVDPPLKMKATGKYPQAADSFEDHVGRKWQRFSRHLPTWQVGRDRLASLWTHIWSILNGATQ